MENLIADFSESEQQTVNQSSAFGDISLLLNASARTVHLPVKRAGAQASPRALFGTVERSETHISGTSLVLLI